MITGVPSVPVGEKDKIFVEASFLVIGLARCLVHELEVLNKFLGLEQLFQSLISSSKYFRNYLPLNLKLC